MQAGLPAPTPQEQAAMEVGLCLGSNLGDRVAALRAARDRIASLPGVKLLAASALYETEPVGVKPEYRNLKFLNAVLVVESTMPLRQLQQALAAIELGQGRVRGDDKFAPRTLDIDLLYAGDAVMETDRLTLPHPRWAKRRFVVAPLAEVRPRLILPGVSRTVEEILRELPEGEDVRRLEQPW